MTVEELIQQLQTYDPRLTVVMPSEMQDFTTMLKVGQDRVWRDRDGRFQLCDFTDEGAFDVVRLYEANSRRP